MLFLTSCSSLPESKIPLLGGGPQFEQQYGPYLSGWIEVDKRLLSDRDIADCKADLQKRVFKAHYKLEKLYRHPTMKVLFAQFDSDEVDDGQVTYVYDLEQRRFVGMLFTGGA